MREIPISEFKARCISIINEVSRSHEPIIITRRGCPVARLEPLSKERPIRQFGKLKGKMQIKGDIVRTDFSEDWEINR